MLSPSLKERRKDSVADSPEVAVEYPWRMVAGTARTERTAAVLHAEVVMGAARAKRARGAAVNFMLSCFPTSDELRRNNRAFIVQRGGYRQRCITSHAEPSEPRKTSVRRRREKWDVMTSYYDYDSNY